MIFSMDGKRRLQLTYVRLSHRSPSYSLGQSQVSGAVQTIISYEKGAVFLLLTFLRIVLVAWIKIVYNYYVPGVVMPENLFSKTVRPVPSSRAVAITLFATSNQNIRPHLK